VKENKKKVIVAGALGNCVHVAGVVSFLRIAEEMGYETHFLGAAVPIEQWVEAVDRYQPDILGVSYRLTPAVATELIAGLRDALGQERIETMRMAFAGTPPVCAVAEQTGLFEQCFTGLEHMNEARCLLGGTLYAVAQCKNSDSLLERLKESSPLPLIRHHFGLPDLDATLRGVEEIADSGVLDVISLAPDQNAQQSFFRPDEMDQRMDGAGGAPIRTKEDLARLKDAANSGNRPLLRIYSGTRDLIPWAELSAETIKNAWGAVPLCWYSGLDGRSDRPLAQAIKENIETMRWYGKTADSKWGEIPLEVNESHHWSLREAHDTIAVVMAYLAAYNAKAAGVSHYIAQYMMNTPPTVTPAMDIAKMLAKIELIESLHDSTFTSYRQVRAGLLHLSPRECVAKGQLATSTAFALQLKPHIIHVVGYCEGDHAAEARDVIESCDIVHGVIRNCFYGQPDFTSDVAIQKRKQELLIEADQLLSAIRSIGPDKVDPFTDPDTLANAIKIGLLDAPHLKGNPFASGELETREVGGAIYAWSRKEERIVTEEERISQVVNTEKGGTRWVV
jgi:methylmalonyl-CoA mutase cobalamin-binding subunit